jgi:hypothetical protein
LNTAAAVPCWSYGGKIYQNGVALAAIDGVAGTYDNAGALVAGSGQSSMAAALNGQLATMPDSEVALVRKKGGARFDITLTDNWKGYASFTEEKRTGSRPFSMNYGSGNATVEIPEPIDYTTSDFLGGLQYVDKLNSINLRASASVFRNNIDVLTIANPLLMPITGFGVVNQSTFDLNPDNTAFNVKGEYARKLPDFFNGRFTASLAYGSNRQNDGLMAPLSSNVLLPTGTASASAGYSNSAAVAPFNVNNWNTTAALSQSSANQRLDSKLLNLGLSLNPLDQLSVRGSLRHYETDNKADDGSGHQYTAYNPLTGQYGVVRYNDSLGAMVASATGVVGSPCYTPNGVAVAGCIWNGPAGVVGQSANNPTGVVAYSLARDYKQDNYVLSADYDLGQRSNLEGSYERENYSRAMRERSKTWEDKLKLSYVNRDFEVATIRASFETDSRRGGEYNSGLLPNVPYYQQVAYGLALPGNSVSALTANYLASLAACSSTTVNTSGAAVLCGLPGYQISVANNTSPAAAAAASTALNNYLARYSAQGRKTDLADRDQNIFNARVNYQARQDLDLGVMVQLKNAKYPSTVYGAEKDNLNSINFDINYQPSSSQQFSAYYSRQDGNRRTTGNSGGNSCTPAGLGTSSVDTWLSSCAMTTAGGAGTGQYPVTAIWNMNTKDSNDVLGFNFQQDLGKVKLAVDYTYGKGRTKINYDYGSTTLSAAQTALEVLAGNALPDMSTTQNAVTLNLMVPIDRRLSARFMVRYEDFKIRDWHYNDVITGAMQNLDGGTLLLDAGPTNFHATTVGVFLQYKL